MMNMGISIPPEKMRDFPVDIGRIRKRDHFYYFVREDSSTCDTIDMILFGSGKSLDSH
jgi:hypothetical protein